MSDAARDSLPSLELDLDGPPTSRRTILIQPRQYMVEYPSSQRPRPPRKGERHYCAEIFDNGRKGIVLGASVLRNREIIFDFNASTITFVDANCGELTPETANLQQAFAFAPCATREAQRSASQRDPRSELRKRAYSGSRGSAIAISLASPQKEGQRLSFFSIY